MKKLLKLLRKWKHIDSSSEIQAQYILFFWNIDTRRRHSDTLIPEETAAPLLPMCKT
jgi:hypothetical protein